MNDRIKDAQAEYLRDGTSRSRPSWGELSQFYGAYDAAKINADLEEAEKTGGLMQQFSKLSNADITATVGSDEPQQGSGFANRQEYFYVAKKAADETKKQRQEDPVLYAMQNNAYGIKPIRSIADTQGFMGELANRYKRMRQISRDYGTLPSLFSKQEAAGVAQYLDALQAPEKARLLGQMMQATDADGMMAFSRQLTDMSGIAPELKDKHSDLAIAANLMAADKSGSAGLQFLQGLDALAEKRAKIDGEAETGTRASISKALEGVYPSKQETALAAHAAYAIYANGRANGIDNIGDAITAATGGLYRYNQGKIAKPYGWTDSQFKDAVQVVVPDVITQQGGEFLTSAGKISAADFAKMLPGARLQNAPKAGTYLVMEGNKPVCMANGLAFILDVKGMAGGGIARYDRDIGIFNRKAVALPDGIGSDIGDDVMKAAVEEYLPDELKRNGKRFFYGRVPSPEMFEQEGHDAESILAQFNTTEGGLISMGGGKYGMRIFEKAVVNEDGTPVVIDLSHIPASKEYRYFGNRK
jgi:hypothetical protein